jgi:hypothetical protein
MALATVLDISIDFNADGIATIDLSSWDWAVVQLVSPSGTVNFLASNDDGAQTGIQQGNSSLATNFTAVQGVNLATGVGATSANASSLFRFPIVGRFLQLSGGQPASKILVYLQKIA